MDSSKKKAIAEDSPSLAGHQNNRSVACLNSASSSLSTKTFRKGINPQTTSTPYPPDEREKGSRPTLNDTPVQSLFQARAPKQDLTLSDVGLKPRQPKVRWTDEEGGELTMTRERSTSPSEKKSLQQTPGNHGPRFSEVSGLINTEPHNSPSRTPIFPLGRSARAEAIHIDYPEPIDPMASSSRVSASPSRWSEGFRDETKTLVDEEDSSSSVEASALLMTVKSKTAATEAEANYMARSARYYSMLQSAINTRSEAGARACEVEAAIGAKKLQLDESMRGIDAKYQSVLKKLEKTRQVPVPKTERR